MFDIGCASSKKVKTVKRYPEKYLFSIYRVDSMNFLLVLLIATPPIAIAMSTPPVSSSKRISVTVFSDLA